MPTVIINDEVVEAQIGETLLSAARRNASHIGFACDGRGMCQTCECYVLAGADQLSPPNTVEKSWQSESQIEKGYRLACQASVRGPGPVKVLTRAEDLRRQAIHVLNPPDDTTVTENIGRLVSDVTRVTLRHIQFFPFNVINTLPQMVRMPPNVQGIQEYVGDTWRMTARVVGIDRTLTDRAQAEEQLQPTAAADTKPRSTVQTTPPTPAPKPPKAPGS